MAFQIACPHCQAPCRVDDQHRGSAVRCHACTRVFMTPPLPGKAPQPTAPANQPAADFPLPSFDALPEPSAATLHLDIGGATTTGKVRPGNEDGYLVCRQTWSRQSETEELAVLAVADGMGGHGGGERACALALQTLQRSLTPLFTEAQAGTLPPDADEHLGKRLGAALIGLVVVLWEFFGGGVKSVFYPASGTPARPPVAELKSPGDERETVKNGSIAPGLAPP